MKTRSIAFWWMVLLFVEKVNSATNRVRRVLNGEEITLDNQGSYAVTRYLVTVATVHEYPWFAFPWWNIRISKLKWDKAIDYWGSYGKIYCSGAVLTPEIVQTACHCLSSWLDPRPPSTFKTPQVDHEWEQVKVLYIGVNNRFDADPSMITQNPIKSKKFIVHQSCRKFTGTNNDPLTYDYGWIKVDPSWTYPGSGVPTYRLAYAPVYDMKEINRIYNKIRETKAVCLHIGFGRYRVRSVVVSRVLRHGWGAVTSDDKCVQETAGGISKESLNLHMNWFCVETYQKHLQPTQFGDSGGPVTCSDQYVGVVSGHRGYNYRDEYNHLQQVYWSIHGATAYTPFSMVNEYRKQFSTELSDDQTQVDIVTASWRWIREAQMRNFSQAGSSCALMKSSSGLTSITSAFITLMPLSKLRHTTNN